MALLAASSPSTPEAALRLWSSCSRLSIKRRHAYKLSVRLLMQWFGISSSDGRSPKSRNVHRNCFSSSIKCDLSAIVFLRMLVRLSRSRMSSLALVESWSSAGLLAYRYVSQLCRLSTKPGEMTDMPTFHSRAAP